MSRTDYMSQNDHVHNMHITDDSTAWGLASVDHAHASDASALLTSLRTIAGALGSAVFVAIMVACGNNPAGVSVAFRAMIALTAVGFIMAVLFCHRR